jgi:hypothetical protein
MDCINYSSFRDPGLMRNLVNIVAPTTSATNIDGLTAVFISPVLLFRLRLPLMPFANRRAQHHSRRLEALDKPALI